MDSESSAKQLEELYLLKSALLPGERLTFASCTDDDQAWQSCLAEYPETLGSLPSRPACVRISVDDAQFFLEINLPAGYPSTECVPTINVKGDNMTRVEQERWRRVVQEHLEEFEGSELVVYEIVSTHLLPQLHAAAQERNTPEPNNSVSLNEHRGGNHTAYHALLTSHHLISPTKRRNLQQWSAQLDITGFAKVGYPGVIYCEGIQDQLEEFVVNVRAMQWLALRVRFVEPSPAELPVRDKRRWVEFEKVGEVVDEMRRLGRESFVVEMGIGSAGQK